MDEEFGEREEDVQIWNQMSSTGVDYCLTPYSTSILTVCGHQPATIGHNPLFLDTVLIPSDCTK